MSSKSLYFYLLKGKVTGPVSFDDIKRMLESGELTHMELLYEEKEKKWKAVGEFSEFSEDSSSDSSIDTMVSSSQLISEADPKDQVEVDSLTSKQESQSSDSEALQNESEFAPELEAEEWVVLKNLPASSSEKYEQIGPLAKSEVVSRIVAGDVGFRDFVWREGYKDWVLIADEEEFRQKVSIPDVKIPQLTESDTKFGDFSEISITDTAVDEIFSDASSSTKTHETLLDEVPEEADGIDALELPVLGNERVGEENDDPEATPSSQAMVEPVEPTEKVDEEEKTSPIKRSEQQPPGEIRRWLVIGFNLFLLSSVLTFVIYTALGSSIQKYIKSLKGQGEGLAAAEKVLPKTSSKTGLNKPKTRKSKPRKRVEKKALAPVNTKQESQPVAKPRVEPSYLKHKAYALGGPKGRLQFLSDGSSHFVLKVTITGVSGEGLYPGAFFRSYRVPMKGKQRVLELKKVRLPEGRYSMKATIGEKEMSAGFFWGANNKAYREKRWLVRKQLSPKHQSEKMALISETDSLLNLSSRVSTVLGKRKPSISKALSAEISRASRRLTGKVTRKKKRALLWPEHWQKLVDSAAELKALDRELKKNSKLRLEKAKEARALNRSLVSQRANNLAVSLF